MLLNILYLNKINKLLHSDKQDEYTSKLSNLQQTGNFKFEKEPSEPKSNVHIEEVD